MVQVLTDGDGEPFGVFLSSNQLKNGAVVRMEPLEGDEYGVRAAALKMVKCLTKYGQFGPCNCQGRVTEDGPYFYEINPRFSGGTGMRASLGFNEVEACLRRLVLNEGSQRLKACLNTRYDRICAMHPAELVMEIPVMDQMQRDGFVDIPRSAGMGQRVMDGLSRVGMNHVICQTFTSSPATIVPDASVGTEKPAPISLSLPTPLSAAPEWLPAGRAGSPPPRG